MDENPSPAADPALLAACGLYCGACGAFRKGKCRGCRENTFFASCPVRVCCLESGVAHCAACASGENPDRCGKRHGLIPRLFGLLFRSDRDGCVRRIRRLGPEAYAADRAAAGLQSLRPGEEPA